MGMAAVAKACGNMFQLLQGHSAETSGGLLICLPREQAAAYCKDIEKQEGYQAWIIGIVEKGQRTARIIDKPRVIEVPANGEGGGTLVKKVLFKIEKKQKKSNPLPHRKVSRFLF